MKATPKDKKYYFAMRDRIWQEFTDHGAKVSKDSVHELLKMKFGKSEGMKHFSIHDLHHEQMQDFKEYVKCYAFLNFGIDLDAGNGIEFNWNLKE